MPRTLILAADGVTVDNVVLVAGGGTLPAPLETRPHIEVADDCPAQRGDRVDAFGRITFRPEPVDSTGEGA
jgi:hypothetical protein